MKKEKNKPENEELELSKTKNIPKHIFINTVEKPEEIIDADIQIMIEENHESKDKKETEIIQFEKIQKHYCPIQRRINK